MSRMRQQHVATGVSLWLNAIKDRAAVAATACNPTRDYGPTCGCRFRDCDRILI